MKKLLTHVMTFLMVVAMGVTAFAAPNNFISSPSANENPELIGWDPVTEDCDAELIVTPFGDREKLDDASRNQLEAARDVIVNTKDLTDLNEDLKKLANDKGIKGGDLSVSDLFDVDFSDCDTHDGHDGFKIKLDSEGLDKFIGLMHFDGEKWTLIDNAKIDENGYLVFTTDKIGSFAIVLNTAEEGGSSSGSGPQTGDYFSWWIYVALMAVSAVALVVVALKLKKSEENQ
ncbi:MAG: hypothetical protein J6Q89_07195 [Clostridia bacterium]|nr:hypothetical protein [Clostridia bacterium]